MNLIKTGESFSRKIFSQTAQGYTEADIIVPDIKPDITRILKADANVCITSHTIQGERLILDAKANICALYLAEGGGVRSVVTSHTFKQVVDSKCTIDDALIDAKLSIVNIESVVVNSRKFCIKLLLDVDVSASTVENLEFTVGVEDDELEQHFTKINVGGRYLAGSGEFLSREVLDVPPGKASISEVLLVNTNVSGHEVKAAGNKVLVKGDIAVSTLFLADDESVHCMEHNLPFSEVIGINSEIREGAEVTADFELTHLSWNPQPDGDGEIRLLGVDVGLCAKLHVKESIILDAMDDAFAVNSNLELTKATINIPHVSMNEEIRLPIAEVISPADGMPEIMQILGVNVRPKVNSTREENGKFVVSGMAHCEVLYFAGSGDVPICNLVKEIPFTHELNHPNAPMETRIVTANLNHSLTATGAVDLRGELMLTCAAVEQTEYKYVTEIAKVEEENCAAVSSPYCLRVYFVKEGDTVWSIAKRFKLKVKDLIEENGEHLMPGQRLVLEG